MPVGPISEKEEQLDQDEEGNEPTVAAKMMNCLPRQASFRWPHRTNRRRRRRLVQDSVLEKREAADMIHLA